MYCTLNEASCDASLCFVGCEHETKTYWPKQKNATTENDMYPIATSLLDVLEVVPLGTCSHNFYRVLAQVNVLEQVNPHDDRGPE